MLKNEPAYSLLLYKEEIPSEWFSYIKAYLAKGIKIYLFSLESIMETVSSDDMLKKAMNNSLLRIYEIHNGEHFTENQCVVADGAIDSDDHFLSLLSESSSFNYEQYILEHSHTSDHLIVKAGAGTGKTTVMLDRILFLKHTKSEMNLKDVAMITFTNESALHMKSKLLERVSNYFEVTGNTKYLKWGEEINDMGIGTIHSLAKKFIQAEGAKIGLMPNVDVRSYVHERRGLVTKWFDDFAGKNPSVFQTFKYIPHYEIVQSILSVIYSIKNKSLTLHDITNADFGLDAANLHILLKEVICNVEHELDEIKRHEQAIEISDLISELKKFHGSFSANHNGFFNYLFIDEFQDTDEAQVSFLAWLASNYDNQLFAVGDVKQSIYRFRGADYTAFEQLKRMISGSYKEDALVKNYRSAPLLLDDFDLLFRSWAREVHTFQYDETDRLIPATFDQGASEGLQLLKMDKEDLRHILQRLQGKDVSILVRSNRDVDEMVAICEKMGFFCEATRFGTFFRSLAIREFYLLIRRFTHPGNWKERFAFHVSSYGERQVGTAQVLEAFSTESRFLEDLLAPYDTFEDELKAFQTTPVLTVLQNLIKKINPAEQYRRRIYMEMRRKNPEQDENIQKKEALARKKEYGRNLEHLLYVLNKEFSGNNATLYKLERYLALKMATDKTVSEYKVKDEGKHRIKVMTVHKSKGLEFDYVVLPATNSPFIKGGKTEIILAKEGQNWNVGYKIHWKEQTFANDLMEKMRSREKEETMGEETRLLYVALTRAKKAVFANSRRETGNNGTISRWSDLLREEAGVLV